MAYLELHQVGKKFGSTVAVQDFNLAVDKGEFISLLGPSGCGKTTTLRMIAGFEQPDHGQILLDGTDITGIPPNRRGVGMVFQAYALFPNLSVYGNIAFGLEVVRRPKQEIQERVREMLALVRLEGMEDRFPYQLSGGQQQRVALARALAIRPRVLLLDEPLSALDAVVRVALRGEIRRIQSELGITTVYVTHDQEEALSISDRVVVMNAGKIEQIGTPQEIYRKPRSLFVAAFIGTANQLHGELVATTQASCLGNLITVPETEAVQESVVVLVRPENIVLHTERPNIPGYNVLEGNVETLTFMGPVTRVTVNVNGERIVADVQAAEGASITHNQHVWLTFAPEACQVMCA
ncbi:MAG: ABC transporter ATP-binding protein [Anaerolineae bacterium]